MSAQIKKSDTAKMSYSGKVSKAAAGKGAKNQKSMGRKVVYALFWLILVFAILAGIALAYIWHNRTSLVESQIRKLMAKQGYDVTLDITKFSKNQAVATNIVVGKEGDVFFKTERAIVDYDFSKRTAQRIELVRPYLKAEFDSKGNITSSWMRPKSDSSQKLLLPPDGLVITDGIIDWQMMLSETSQMGAGQAYLDADIITATHWSTNISSQKTSFNFSLLKAEIKHDVFIETKDGKSFDIFGSMDVENFIAYLTVRQASQFDKLNTQFKFNFTPTDGLIIPAFSGWMNANLGGLATGDYEIGKVDIKLSEISSNQKGEIFANWLMDAAHVQISDTQNRYALADRLTSHSALANTPIAQYFTQGLYNKAAQLLGGFDIDGRGSYASIDGGYTLKLDAPLSLKAPGQKIVFTQKDDVFLNFDMGKKQLAFGADIQWTGQQALNLTDFTLLTKSANGIKIDGLHTMKTRVRSQQTWRLQRGGDNIRLAPFDINFTYTAHLYKAQGRNTRVGIDGGVDYDGPVPGGSVVDLVADGKMDLRLSGDDFTLGYTPTKPLSIAAFTNPSGWTTKALTFIIEPQADLLRKTSHASVMRTTLKNVSTQIIGPENKRHLDARFEKLDVRTDFTTSPQHWKIGVKGADIKSEDFPAPGTHIISPDAKLNVFQAQSGAMTFDLASPDTYVATDNAVIENLNIGLSGSPDDIALTYNAGSVTMVGGAVPVLPMHGTARLKSGVLTGRAVTNLPRTTDTPIDIHYRSKDGQGSAKILIPKIIFDPRGLQPQHLVPVLRGKLAEVSGEASAEFNFVFGGGKPVQSSGWADLKNLDIGTLVGPLSGVNAKLVFTSIFPLKTRGIQTATLTGFDPGFPLQDGTIKFEIIPGGIKLFEAAWPIENVVGSPGKIYLSPTDWRFGDVENRVEVNVENVGLGTMLAGIGKDKLSATGQVFGTLPARINGVDVLIEGGVLTVKDGGIIRYKSGATDAAAARNENAGHAFKALENFHYKQLEARIDGPIDGAMALKIVFDGQNPEVLGGQPFQFNPEVTGELANIARNMASAFSNEENLARIIEIQKSKIAE
ncbi:MAG: YdbH domain-containing protein [Robiginitomaculum sp.]|nr:YdbH domain-containing protein [Robiginitomaculum sp.]